MPINEGTFQLTQELQRNQTIQYIYDANGQKLAKTAPDGTKTYYAGNFVYNGDELRYILHNEGKTDMSGGTPVYQCRFMLDTTHLI